MATANLSLGVVAASRTLASATTARCSRRRSSASAMAGVSSNGIKLGTSPSSSSPNKEPSPRSAVMRGPEEASSTDRSAAAEAVRGLAWLLRSPAHLAKRAMAETGCGVTMSGTVSGATPPAVARVVLGEVPSSNLTDRPDGTSRGLHSLRIVVGEVEPSHSSPKLAPTPWPKSLSAPVIPAPVLLNASLAARTGMGVPPLVEVGWSTVRAEARSA
mmetsp:Transcript_48018/g.112893  ORF Transcript_48018/g.112893 Transcript_48018/m.112893 type:complete len:216 (-) Transcript_48018:278-925(-)